MQRFLGLDIGKKRTGVALVDDQSKVATPLETISFVPNTNQFIDRLIELIHEWEPEAVIVGLPIDLKGKESVAASQMRTITSEMMNMLNLKLKKSGKAQLQAKYVDERLTTAQAEKSLKSADFSSEYRKKHRDALAAAVIAQSWVDTL